jgi:hypothetical protein
VKKIMVGLVVAALAAFGALGSSNASADNRPNVTVNGPTTTVTDPSTTVTFSANRGGSQLLPGLGVICTLSGPTTSSDCGTVTTGRGSTTGTVVLSDLTSGDYTFTVSMALTDGEVARAMTRFTVLLSLPDLVPVVTCSPGWSCLIQVKNIGLGTMNGLASVDISLHTSVGTGFSHQQTAVQGPLAPGDSFDTAQFGNAIDGATSIHIDVTVDSTNVIAESNESNNSLSQDFPV